MNVGVQSTTTGGAEDVFHYLEDLLKTDRFRKSPSLNHLLEYLVRKAVEGKNDEVKESIIAIDVFGRSCEFDGRLDNIVRVQAHRLRKILDAYYAAEGSHDRFVISIPKGSYIAAIHPREEPTAQPLLFLDLHRSARANRLGAPKADADLRRAPGVVRG